MFLSRLHSLISLLSFSLAQHRLLATLAVPPEVSTSDAARSAQKLPADTERDTASGSKGMKDLLNLPTSRLEKRFWLSNASRGFKDSELLKCTCRRDGRRGCCRQSSTSQFSTWRLRRRLERPETRDQCIFMQNYVTTWPLLELGGHES